MGRVRSSSLRWRSILVSCITLWRLHSLWFLGISNVFQWWSFRPRELQRKLNQKRIKDSLLDSYWRRLSQISTLKKPVGWLDWLILVRTDNRDWIRWTCHPKVWYWTLGIYRCFNLIKFEFRSQVDQQKNWQLLWLARWLGWTTRRAHSPRRYCGQCILGVCPQNFASLYLYPTFAVNNL